MTMNAVGRIAPTRCLPRFNVRGVDAMGRGRQKAKQTKVARELKYFSPHTDYRALERELTSHSEDVDPYAAEELSDDEDDNPWPVRATR
jgi:hypothetical protein